MKNIITHIILSFLFILLFNNNAFNQNCPSLNVIGTFYDLPSGTPPNFTDAQADGLCYELSPPYPPQVCFEYLVPTSDTVRMNLHLKACGSQSSIGTGTYSGGCSGTSSGNATFTGQSTYDSNCNLIGNYVAAGYCGGSVSGDILTVCFNLNTSSACDPITICPMLFCNTASCSTTLPIDLLSFEANCEEEQTIIKWTTITEINNDYFLIEKSNNGIDFQEVGIVKGSGNNIGEINYSLIDNEINNKATYYRLKQTDFNGDYNYSKLITNNCTINNFNIYPNPVNNIINVDWKNYNQPIKSRIINSLGKVFLEKNMTNSKNSINIEHLAPGFYQIQLIDSKQQLTTKKFIKQ